MKRFWISILSVVMLVGMVGIMTAQADSMASSMQPVGSEPTLTVVFGAPPVFEPVPAPVVTERAKLSAAPAAGGTVPTNSQATRSVTQVTPVPEPSTLILIGIGVLGLVGIARRKKN